MKLGTGERQTLLIIILTQLVSSQSTFLISSFLGSSLLRVLAIAGVVKILQTLDLGLVTQIIGDLIQDE